jgi:predicted amidophosphoribosyltransferase
MGPLTSKIKCGDAWFTHFYLCPYLPLTAGPDALSQSLLNFKQRIQPDLDAWIDCSVQSLGALPFSPDTIILRALRHDETTARMDFPSALDLLGNSLATRLRCRYLPTLLTKSRPTLPGKHLTRRGRRSQLQDVYQLITTPPSPTPDADLTGSAPDANNLTPSTPFLHIDDILTTGATMRALISTIRQHYPDCPIKTFTLTRADYRHQTRPPTPGSENCPVQTLKSLLFANTF